MSDLSPPTSDTQKYRDALSAIGKAVIATCSSFHRIEHAWESNDDVSADDIDLLVRIVNEITEAVITGLSQCGEGTILLLSNCPAQTPHGWRPIMNQSHDDLLQADKAKARKAFEGAIAAGILSKNEKAENAAANYMFMGTVEEGDAFKHIGTRQYIYHKQGDAT